MIIQTNGESTNNIINAAFDELKFHTIISNKSIPLVSSKGTRKYITNDYIGKIRYEYVQLISMINTKYGLDMVLTEINRNGDNITLRIEYNNKELELEL